MDFTHFIFHYFTR